MIENRYCIHSQILQTIGWNWFFSWKMGLHLLFWINSMIAKKWL